MNSHIVSKLETLFSYGVFTAKVNKAISEIEDCYQLEQVFGTVSGISIKFHCLSNHVQAVINIVNPEHDCVTYEEIIDLTYFIEEKLCDKFLYDELLKISNSDFSVTSYGDMVRNSNDIDVEFVLKINGEDPDYDSDEDE